MIVFHNPYLSSSKISTIKLYFLKKIEITLPIFKFTVFFLGLLMPLLIFKMIILSQLNLKSPSDSINQNDSHSKWVNSHLFFGLIIISNLTLNISYINFKFNTIFKYIWISFLFKSITYSIDLYLITFRF
jgi:hypothetical protein